MTFGAVRSWRSALADRTGKPSVSSTCRSRRPRPKEPSGSRRSATGHSDQTSPFLDSPTRAAAVRALSTRDQAKAAADGAALQAGKAAQAAKDSQGALTTVQGAEQTAKQAADTAKTKRAAAETAQATAADAKNKAAAAQARAATDQATAQTKADAATKAAQDAQTAGATAAQKRAAAQTADTAAQDARRKAWDGEQAHNAAQAKADSADAYAAAQASGSDAQAAKDAAATADADATTAKTNADAASKAADQATADAKTADAEATRAEGEAAQAKSAASDANAAKATADQAVRTDQSAVSDARAAADRASGDAADAQQQTATAQSQADSAKANAIQAWAQAGQAQTTAAAAAGYAYATAQAAGAASTSAKQVVDPANDAVQLGAPYQDTDISAGLAVLTGQGAKTIAAQQQAVAQLKADQAKQAADQAASLANAATGDAQTADRFAANAAASAAAAKSSAKDALASAATAAQALADALASQARTIDYDTQATGDAAAATSASQGAAGDASDARNSAIAAANDADKAKVAASDAQTAANTAREVATQAAKDADAAAAAAKDAQLQAAAAQQSAQNAEALAAADQAAAARSDAQKAALAQQTLLQTGGATGLQGVFTRQQVTPIGDPIQDNECKLTTITSFCDVTFTLRFNVRIDYYMQMPTAPGNSDLPGPAAAYSIVWLGSNTIEVDRNTTQRFTAVQVVWKLSKAVIEAVAQSLQKDSDECSRSNGTSPSCVTALSFLPQGRVAKGAELALDTNRAISTGIDLDKVLAAVKVADLEGPTAAQLTRDLEAAQRAFASCATNSFPAGTQVLLADGSHKSIDAIRTGDRVLATDAAARSSQAEPVTAAFSHGTDHLVTISLDNGGRLTTTAWHRVYVPQRGWTFAIDLHSGDQLQSQDGSQHTVTVLRDQNGVAPTTVYDLTVSGLHTFYVLAGDTPVLVHNALCPTQIAYDSDELSTAAFEYRLKSGYWEAERNVAVARVRGSDGTERLVYGNSGSPTGHAEQDILAQLKVDDKVLALYTDRAPCPDICSPLLSTDERTKAATITYVIPYASPSTPDGQFLNGAWAEHLAGLIKQARTRRGLS